MPPHRSSILFVVSLGLLVALAECNELTLMVTQLDTQNTTAVKFSFLPVIFQNANQPIGQFEGLRLLGQNSSTQLQDGALVFVNSWVNPVDNILTMLHPNVAAVVLHNKANKNQPGQELVLVKSGMTDIHIPFLSVSAETGEALYQLVNMQNTTITARFFISGNETNPWNIYPQFWPVQIMMGVACLIGLGLAIWRVSQFCFLRHFKIGFVCGVLLTFSFIFKFFATAIDPRGALNVAPPEFRSWFTTFHLPFGFSCALLVSLFWHETLSDTGIQVNPFLGRLKIPFFVTLGLLFGLEIAFSVIRVLGINVLLGNVLVYLVLSFAIGGFYMVTGIRILRAIRRDFSTSRKKIIQETRRRSIFLMICVFGYYLFIIGALLNASPVFGFEGKPAGMATALTVGWCGTIIADLALALSIIPPSPSDLSRSSKTSNSSDKRTHSKNLDKLTTSLSLATRSATPGDTPLAGYEESGTTSSDSTASNNS